MRDSPSTDINASVPLLVRRAPATCGELIQGALDGGDFLVNCPINLYSQARLYPSGVPGVHIRDRREFAKVHDVIALVSERAGLCLANRLAIDSPIPRGKGMASSTADITAAAGVVCDYYGVSFSGMEFARLVTEVEPSDCVHFPGIAHVNHLTGELLGSYPVPKGLRVLTVDCGGMVDTLAFDRERARRVYRSNEPLVRSMVDLMLDGLASGDVRAVGKAASMSARLSQQILPKRPLDALIRISDEQGGLGINCAHSGTVLGVLHAESESLVEILRGEIEHHFGSDVEILGDFAIVGGGWHAC